MDKLEIEPKTNKFNTERDRLLFGRDDITFSEMLIIEEQKINGTTENTKITSQNSCIFTHPIPILVDSSDFPTPFKTKICVFCLNFLMIKNDRGYCDKCHRWSAV